MNGIQEFPKSESVQNVNPHIGTENAKATKTCPKCGEILPIYDFYKDRKIRRSICKKCIAKNNLLPRNKKRRHEYAKVYYQENPERMKEHSRVYAQSPKGKKRNDEYGKIWRQENKEYVKIQNNIYRGLHKDGLKEYGKAYYEANKEKKKIYFQKNKDKIRKYQRQRMQENPKLRLHKNMAVAIWRSLKTGKSGHRWGKFVSFTKRELSEHLEKLFKVGMAWENYGKWHIDHIIPVSSFDFLKHTDLEFQQCWALSNLQPLWAEENMRKSGKIIS